MGATSNPTDPPVWGLVRRAGLIGSRLADLTGVVHNGRKVVLARLEHCEQLIDAGVEGVVITEVRAERGFWKRVRKEARLGPISSSGDIDE